MGLVSPTRKLLVLLVLVCFAGLQTASAVTANLHDHGAGHSHCCVSCHAGHAPLLGAGVALNPAPPTVTEWRCWREEAVVAGAPAPALSRSRAPPA